MKTIILCGGLGSRLSEETKTKPKPMVRIGGLPILLHIISIYKSYGFKDFILATGYKSEYIKKYFSKKLIKKLNCNIKVVFTGKKTMTGGRVLRLKKFFKSNENFMMTYGDGLTGQNLKNLVKFHLKSKKLATVTAVRPPIRFGEISLKGKLVNDFREKIQSNKGWINGGYFVLNYKIFKFIKNDQTMFEKEPMQKLVFKNQLAAFKHKKFWHCIDTMRDKAVVENIIKTGKVPWKK
tara:strand:+ start:530 stop:1240 length:711 start_codon:yes stop_codon:yes gene_type:complete